VDETASPEASDARFRQVLGQYPTGVCVVTGITQDGQPTGLAVGSFTSLSLHPPLVAFMPDKTSSSWPKIRPANAFCVNILSAASAGGLDDPTWATVGQRYPAVAPIGSNIMAWQEPGQIGSWLSGVESSRQRRTYLRRLEQARQRGYSVMMDSPHRSRLTEMAGQHLLPGTYAEMSAEQRKTLAGLPIDPLDFSAEQAHKVRFIYVPVFGADGTAPISLGVRLAHSLDSPQQLKCYVRHMQEVSDRVTESIGGRIPSREKIQ
jgi:Flavin reductase like domain